MDKWRVGQRISVECPVCQQKRTVVCRSVSKPYNKLCGGCATAKSHKDNPRIGRAESHYNWKGGINLNRQGYIIEYVKKDNPFFPMATSGHSAGGYILQHRLVMAKHLGRYLESYEIVHHINGVKTDNGLENLNLVNKIQHNVTYQNGYRNGYTRAMIDNNKGWGGEDWER